MKNGEIHRHSIARAAWRCLVIVLALAATAGATPGAVKSHQKISSTQGGFTGAVNNDDWFGSSVVSLGDLDGDGIGDLAVGARLDDDGGANRGAVWVLFLKTDGTVKAHQKISDTQGGFTGVLDDADGFGSSVASLGDLDGDGVGDLAVGATQDVYHGAVWILFLNTDGTVKAHQKINHPQGGFNGLLELFDSFGTSLAPLGDLDGDGVGDLAVGAPFADDGGTWRGAVWVLFLNGDGTVKSHQKISDTQSGFIGVLEDDDRFGSSLASLGDLDGDGVGDLAVGAHTDNDGGFWHGAVWVLFLNPDGTVKSHQKISDTEGGFTGTLGVDLFGSSVVSLGDLDGDGVGDLAVGAILDRDGDSFPGGAVWVLFLKTDGTVKSHQKISDTQGGFPGTLEEGDWFGSSVASLGDLDGDGVGDLAVGAARDDDGGSDCGFPAGCDRGAVWVLFLDGETVDPPCDEIHSLWPPNCAIDARQPSGIAGPPAQGWNSLDVRVVPAECTLALGDLSADSRPTGPAPGISNVSQVGDVATITFGAVIPLRNWTCVSLAADATQKVCLGNLPGDVNGDGTSNPALDLSALIDCINNPGSCAGWQENIDRTGTGAGVLDLTRLIDLFNGAGAYESFTGASFDGLTCPSG